MVPLVFEHERNQEVTEYENFEEIWNELLEIQRVCLEQGLEMDYGTGFMLSIWETLTSQMEEYEVTN